MSTEDSATPGASGPFIRVFGPVVVFVASVELIIRIQKAMRLVHAGAGKLMRGSKPTGPPVNRIEPATCGETA